jgi:RNA polymerase sigma factor (sigma-70 family)
VLNEADRFLLERVRQKDAQAWAQLVERYQGRLLAFARGQRVRSADAEDFVQDTFLNFLRGAATFRGDASLETYLFLLLRRRIVDALRGRRIPACAGGESSVVDDAAPVDGSASWYVRRDEQLDARRAALARAVMGLAEGMRTGEEFRDLQLAEMLFYAQMRNTDIARALGLEEGYVALRKHRWVKQLRAELVGAGGGGGGGEEETAHASLLSEVWEEHRPSCPKRSTLGGYLLGTLDEGWTAYVKFHVERLGCRFCNANLDDLRRETAEARDTVRDRVMQSTVGFFRRG